MLRVMAVTLALVLLVLPATAKDKTAIYRKSDPAMKAAIARARVTLPEFWTMKKSPQAGLQGFFLKVGVTEPGNKFTEHFWLSDIKRLATGKISGRIDNDPSHMKTIKLGQRYTFTQTMISDWMFRRKGKIVGAHTLRVMLKRLPKARADQLRSMLEKP